MIHSYHKSFDIDMEYTALNSDVSEIRLLTILPDEAGSTPVHCTLDHASLINPPQYVALSYCWGDVNVSEEIIINGYSTQVSANLESALRHLRAKGYARLWVDAICINQPDKVEKTQQLLWMGTIYRRASEVAAWTGDLTEEMAQLMNFIRGENYGDARIGNRVKERLKTDLFSSALMRLIFFKFLERPYWWRIWVVQELALSKCTIVHCGEESMTWEELISAVRGFETWIGNDTVLATESKPAIENIRGLIRFQKNASLSVPMNLLDALHQTLLSSSSEPRDKVFALLGLVYDSALFVPIPNYRQSIETTCLAITISAISNTGRIDFVPLLGAGSTMTDWPSWIPKWYDLRGTLNKRKLPYMYAELAWDKTQIVRNLEKIGPFSKQLPEIFVTGNVLKVRGFILDIVDGLTLTAVEVTRNNNEDQAKQFVQSTSQVEESVFWPYGSLVLGASTHSLKLIDENAFPIFMRNGLFERARISALKACTTSNPYFESASPQVKAWIRALSSFKINGLAWNQWGRVLNNEEFRYIKHQAQFLTPCGNVKGPEIEHGDIHDIHAKQSSMELYDKLDRELGKNLRFMTTVKGRMGWAHVEAQKGDVICLWQGCRVPVLLRKRPEGGFILVGECDILTIRDSNGPLSKRMDFDIH